MTFILGIVVVVGAAVMALVALGGDRETATEGASGEQPAAGTSLYTQEIQQSAWSRLIGPGLGTLGRHIARTLPPGRIKALRRKIVLAGLAQTWSVEKAMAYKALGIIVGAVAGFIIFTSSPSIVTGVAAGLVVVIGFFVVDFILDKSVGKRQLEIQRALPDLLDQITVCVEAGLGFDSAMSRCATANDNALAFEMNRTLQDIRLGLPRSDALRAMLDRTDVPDLRLFVRAFIQAEKSGIPIARVLRVQAEEAREKRRQAAEERAMKLPVLLIMPLVLCILPSLFVVIMGPAALRLIRNGAV